MRIPIFLQKNQTSTLLINPRNRAYTRIEAARTILSKIEVVYLKLILKLLNFKKRINALEGRRIIDIEAN